MRRLLCVLAATATGCVLTTSLGGFASGVADTPDGSTEDAAARNDGDASNGLTEAGTGVDAGTPLVREGFEDSAAGCAPWVVFSSQLTGDGKAHTGLGSCRVCSTSKASFTIDRFDNLDPNAKIGDVYRAAAWVRRGPAAAQLAVGMAIRVFDPQDSELERSETPQPIVLTDTWQLLRVEHTVTKKPARINLFVYGIEPQAVNDCFLVDDITLEKN